MTDNPSGIRPVEFKVVIEPKAVEEVTKGGIILADQTIEKDKYAAVQGKIVAVSEHAFTYVDEWKVAPPMPGDQVIFAKYAGLRQKGRDGKDYLVLNDKDIVAVLE